MTRKVMFMIKILAAEIVELALKKRLSTTNLRGYAKAELLMTSGPTLRPRTGVQPLTSTRS